MKGKLSLLFPVILSYLVGACYAEAATYTVKAGGGGNYTTIKACISAMSSSGGNTCTVFAGTYNESPSITAGTAGNYNTLTVNPGDTVSILAATINSHTKLNGFHIANTSSPSSAPCVSISLNATDWFVTSNVMQSCGSSAMIQEPYYATSTGYGYIQGNTLSYGCSLPSAPNVCEGMLINGNYHLIENNDISHVSDGVTNYGSWNVYRNNTMHDTSPSDCGSNSSNCHIDFIESEPNTSGGITFPAQFLLYEGNYITNNSGSNAHAFLTQGDGCGGSCNNAIIRYNHAYILGTYWILDQLGNFSHVKVYNSTVVCGLDGTACGVSSIHNTLSAFQGSTYGAAVNELYYNSVPNGSEVFYAGSSPFRENNNLVYTSSCAPNCSYSSPYNSEGGRVANQDPRFVVPASDWNLQAGSPAIAAGAALTNVAASDPGSGTSLVVNDADYFYAGNGLTGVQADWIRVGTSNTVQISSINYSTNTITLANGISRSSGDPVYLYKNSSGTVVLGGGAPDIGAYPYLSSSSPLTPPTNLAAVPH